MKKFAELTDLEIYNLSAEEIKTYKKVELAEHGVIFPVKPKEPELEEEPKPDITLYTIPLIESRLAFKDEEEARNVLTALQQATSIGLIERYGTASFVPGFGTDYNGEKKILAVEPKAGYSAELYKTKCIIAKRNAEKRDAYKKDCDAHNELMEKVNETLKPLREKIENACDNIRNKMRLTHIFVNDYMSISDNDVETAMKYMKLAYHLSESDEAYIRENC
ncbi:MAG: hypothetical protein IJ640_00725 [Prevotella sp.]|nr:hypothetical protein [Prevotella sp.]